MTNKKKLFKIFSITIGILLIAYAGMIIYNKGVEDKAAEIRKAEIKQLHIQDTQKNIEVSKTNIAEAKARLQMAMSKLDEINSFHFLRTSSEKQDQLTAQNRLIDDLKEELTAKEQRLNNLQLELQASRY
jgi:hypothetical protein